MKKKFRYRQLFLLFISTIISIVVVFGMGEILSRIIYPFGCSRRHPILHHSYAPNCIFRTKTDEFDIEYRYSSLGLRDKERILPKPKNFKRMIMLGDSFTEGAGVNSQNTFSAILEKELSTPNQRVEVVNAGISGYSPLLEYLYLREYGLELDPDAVILNINVTDLIENEKFHLMAQKNKLGEVIALSTPGRHFLPSFMRFYLWNHSRLYAHLQQKTIPRLLKMYWTIKIKLLSPGTPISPAISLSVPSSATINNPFTLSLNPESADRYTGALGSIQQDIQSISELLRKHNIRFLVVLQPHGYHVSKSEWKEGKKFYQLPEDKIIDEPFFEDIKKYADGLQLDFLNLTQAFREKENLSSGLYYPYDGHWTVVGQQLAALNLKPVIESILFQKKAIQR